MAYYNRNAAYDLSLFEEKKQRVHNRDNIIDLPSGNANVAVSKKSLAARSLLPFMGLAICSVLVAFSMCNQVQITEMSDKVNVLSAKLEESKSVSTQLQMKIEQDLSLSQVEKYASEKLDMKKAPGNVQYVSVAKSDVALYHEHSGDGVVDKIFREFTRLW